jgi:NAD(P)-dependent dehydrogenase (short-subunit alcohol dehydrogenase family)
MIGKDYLISSMGGLQGSKKFSGLSGYSAAKGTLTILAECLAEEWKQDNISVNCLCLGAVNTEMLQEAFPGYKAPVEPQDMARYICQFALDAHQFMNGRIIPIALSDPD